VTGYNTALPPTEISDTTEEQKFFLQTTSDEKLQTPSLSALNPTGQQTIDQDLPKLDEGEERQQYASRITRRKDTEEMVGMIPSETTRRRTFVEQTQIDSFVEEPESTRIHPADIGS
jgi:hypothetical protein